MSDLTSFNVRKSPEYERAIRNMVAAARAANAPEDQIRNFMVGGYMPTPHQWKFHAAARMADHPLGPTSIAMGGARGGAKSHAIMCQVALDDCQRFPGLDVLYLRMIKKAGRKALDQLRAKTIMNLRHRYNRQEGLIAFPNGSQIVVGHFKNEGDIDKYVGIEFDLMVVEERTQLSQFKLDQLFGSLRSSKPGWRPRSYNASNPGGIGHQDFRSTFIIPSREKRQHETMTYYLNMDWRHNPFINPEYKHYLMNLTGILGEMWRDGNWDVGSGTFFIFWEPAIHIVEPRIRVPYEWPMWLSMDWGHAHPCDVQWHTVRPDGAIETVAEYHVQRKLVKEVADDIKKITGKFDRKISDLVGFVAGHDIYANRGSNPDNLTIADQFEQEGINWQKANVDRVNGAAQMTQRLGNPKEGIPATWFISRACEELTHCIPNMIVDEKRPEDVLKINANEFGEGGDDPYDCARYGLMVRPLLLSPGGYGWRF